MEDNTLTPEDLIQLIYGSEDEKLAKKVLSLYMSQQKEKWVAACYDRQAELASKEISDLEGSNKA